MVLLSNSEPADVPATPSVIFDVPSVTIPATTLVSVVPAPRTTALAVRFPPVLVTVPEPEGVAQTPSPLQNVDDEAEVPELRCEIP